MISPEPHVLLVRTIVTDEGGALPKVDKTAGEDVQLKPRSFREGMAPSARWYVDRRRYRAPRHSVRYPCSGVPPVNGLGVHPELVVGWVGLESQRGRSSVAPSIGRC